MKKCDLSTKKCKPCEGSTAPLTQKEAKNYLAMVPGWEVDDSASILFKHIPCKNFMEGIEKINRIAVVAEEEGHHPDLHITAYRHLRIELSTYAIQGLSENDFILAAKISSLF